MGGRQSGIVPGEELGVKYVEKEPESVNDSFCLGENNWEKILLNQKMIADLATLQIAGLEQFERPALVGYRKSQKCRLSY